MRRQRMVITLLSVALMMLIWPWIRFDYTSTINQIDDEINSRLQSIIEVEPLAVEAMAKSKSKSTADEDSEPKPKPKPVPLSKRVVEYHIHVELDEENKILYGKQTVTWHNPGTKSVNQLYWHLYANAFESPDTTFMRESGGKLRNDARTENSIGHIQMNKVVTIDGVNLTRDATYIQPDDGNPHDRTLMKLPLPQEVQPGSSITLNMEFTVQLPEAFARMGYKDDYILAGQWFPKVAAYETIGVRGKSEESWNLHQYHGNSEFYANFGLYDVKIDVPKNYTVAATGMPLSNAKLQGERKQYHFYAEDVHDFAWAASPHFVYAEQVYSTPHVPGVKIKLYLDPLHKDLEERYFDIAKKALSRFSEWYGAYPYTTLSIVVPPIGGNGTGGMEYPTFITSWSADVDLRGNELERVVAHEIAHQYWQGMVANNEFEEAWLDEGFATYAEGKLMKDQLLLSLRLPLEAIHIVNPKPLNQFAWNFGSHQTYAENVYTRARLVLTAIEQKVGEKTMNQILRTYFQKYKFKHPTSADFQRVVENVTGRKWNDFFDQFVYGSSMTDFEVVSIERESEQRNSFVHIVTIRRHDGVNQAVPVVFHFQDGSTIERSWQANNEQVRYRVTSRSPLEWVTIDPDYQLVLENKRLNNFKRTEIDLDNRSRWSAAIVKSLETLVGLISW